MKLILALPAALLVLLTAACSGETSDAPNIGYVEADWRYIAAPQPGWIVEQTVAEGDRISLGDTLFRLDAGAEEAALAEAEARLRQASAEAANIETGAREPEIRALQARLREAEARLSRLVADRARIQPLVDAGIEPRSRGEHLAADVLAAEAAVEAIRQEIQVARLSGRPAAREAADAATESLLAARDRAAYRLSQRTVTAGLSGRVEQVLLEPGEYASPGQAVLVILPDDGLMVRFFVPQAELPGIAIGQAVAVKADGLETPVQAMVSHIATDPEFTPPVIYSRDGRDKLVFLVQARLEAASPLLPGLPVEVSW